MGSASCGVGARGVGEGRRPPSGWLLPRCGAARSVSGRDVLTCAPAHRATGLPGSSAAINRGPRAFPRPRATHPSASSPLLPVPNKEQQRKVSATSPLPSRSIAVLLARSVLLCLGVCVGNWVFSLSFGEHFFGGGAGSVVELLAVAWISFAGFY